MSARRISLSVDDLGLGHDLLGERARNHDHAVAIAQQVIASRDGYGADGDRLAVSIGHPARDDVCRRQEGAEDREALLDDELGIA